uniref:Uncharacterized protein n=1 Tax=Aegilops tauschii subsp. strangulata TaxID=200361 RepID=A0A453RZT2_AEGTS
HDPCLRRGWQHIPLGRSGTSSCEKLKQPKTPMPWDPMAMPASLSLTWGFVVCLLSRWYPSAFSPEAGGMSLQCFKLGCC